DEPEPGRSALLRELLRLDLHYRRRRGERLAAADYEARFPDAEAAIRAAVAGRPADESVASDAARTGPYEPAPGAGVEPTQAPAAAGRNVLFDEIGRGGMGAVFKGRDTELGRELAVKVLLEEHRGRPELVRRFLEEAQIAGQLQHPGVAPVYELGR